MNCTKNSRSADSQKVNDHISVTAVVGMPLSGKTSLSRSLRDLVSVCHAGVEIVELDEEAERRSGMCIPELFARRGEAYFRRVEAELLEEYAHADHPVIVFAGGGVLTGADSKAALLLYDRIVFLRADLTTLKKRMSPYERSKRPLLCDHPERIAELYAQRNPLFHEIATDVIDVDHMTVDALARLFIEQFLGGIGMMEAIRDKICWRL